MKKDLQDGLPGHSNSDLIFSENYMDPNNFPEDDDYEGYEDMEALWEPDYDDRLDRYVDQEEWWGDVDDYLDTAE